LQDTDSIILATASPYLMDLVKPELLGTAYLKERLAEIFEDKASEVEQSSKFKFEGGFWSCQIRSAKAYVLGDPTGQKEFLSRPKEVEGVEEAAGGEQGGGGEMVLRFRGISRAGQKELDPVRHFGQDPLANRAVVVETRMRPTTGLNVVMMRQARITNHSLNLKRIMEVGAIV
jgi:hypothetical protein